MGGDLYATFLANDFDPNHYANSVLARNTSSASVSDSLAISSDVGPAISRLNGGIDELHRQLRSKVPYLKKG